MPDVQVSEGRARGKYPISVASSLTGVPEHRLRAFEAAGLVKPSRTEGQTRLYSDADLGRIRRVAELADKGVNYAGIREILSMSGEELPSEPGQDQNGEEATQS